VRRFKLVTSKFARRTQAWHGFWFLTLRHPYGTCYEKYWNLRVMM